MSNTLLILVTESLRFSGEAARILRSAGELRLADLDRDSLRTQLSDVEVLWVRLRHKIDADILDAAPRLRIIATPTTGLNHVDTEEARRRDIRVVSLRGETDFLREVPATAEHSMALILSLLRRLPAAADHARRGGWNRDLFCGTDLCGKTAGVIGYGRIGRMVAQRLLAFGVKVLAADPCAGSADPGVRLVPMQELLEQSDIVTLHVNLTEQTAGLIGWAEFLRMKAGAWFINTSRVELIDEDALLEALGDGRLAGAAVDVLSDENANEMAKSALIEYAERHDNLIVTPHIGGCTRESMEKTEVFLAGRVAAAIEKIQYACAE